MKHLKIKQAITGLAIFLGLSMTSCQSGKGSSGCGYWSNQETPEEKTLESNSYKVYKTYSKTEKSS